MANSGDVQSLTVNHWIMVKMNFADNLEGDYVMLRKLLISFGAVIAISAASSSAHAYCNLDGDNFSAVQSNNTTAFFLKIHQKGIRLQGTTKFRNTYGVFSGFLLQDGRLQLTARWDDGITGIYDGWVTPDGDVLSGSTHERGNPSNSASWRLGNRLDCVN